MIWGASLPYVPVRSFSPETLSATEFGGHGGYGGWVFQGWEDCCFNKRNFRVWLNLAV